MLAANPGREMALLDMAARVRVATGVVILATGVLGGPGCIPDLPRDAPAHVVEDLCGNGRIDLDAGEQCDPGSTAGPPEVTGCTAACQMYCPRGYVSAANHHCYELGENASTGDRDAPRICSSQIGSHVATFASAAEFQEVAGWVDAVDGGAFWVGLQGLSLALRNYASANASSPEPGWSPTCPGCYAHCVDASAPLPHLPDAPTGQPDLCVVAYSDVAGHPTWYRSSCSLAPAVLHTVCEREPVGSLHSDCDAGVCIWLTETFRSKRYVYVSHPASSDAAAAACAGMGGRLVIFASRDEREQLWHELWLLPARPARFWIGLAEVDGEAGSAAPETTWVWDDGMPSDSTGAYPSPWAEGEPANDADTERAFAGVNAGQVDDTLAFVNELQTSLPFVCQLAVGDASAN
jgi:Lectin C-type domain